ncbi:MAG: hypothetical protein COU28_03050 [Candidatus Magasanikbacteria bacterium CG10_big_fil_rev_8_21_14_0_10_36_16]|uniref:Uncharacterized protein n=1 Tax=Candidatus Magasanikbacteria bacterium CG10_big_fil_rev_8_21_14_0_10_36_16 TaxID=1974645 RepID=A0A2H0TY76_9BACT|nr:MAG: hypothetical protein COU28_03050 [Candidatus Magasanikbacteria bacterium CG10_big_fil_rev_8_21_14_0_10_36_16]
MKKIDKELLVIGEIIEAVRLQTFGDMLNFRINEVEDIDPTETYKIINGLSKKYSWYLRAIPPLHDQFDLEDAGPVTIFDTFTIYNPSLDSLKSLKEILLKEKNNEMEPVVQKTQTKILGNPPLEIREDENIYEKEKSVALIKKGSNCNYYFVRACIEKNNADDTVDIKDIFDDLLNKKDNLHLRAKWVVSNMEERIKSTYHNCIRKYPNLKKYLQKEEKKSKKIKWLSIV